MQPAVFLDRDGTLNRELSSYVRSAAELEVFDYAGPALVPLVQRGIPLVLISNQQGVGKGLMSESDLHQIENKLAHVLSGYGVYLTAAYYCLHLDSENCPCRKPKGGLITKAADDLGLDLPSSFMVGDNWRDMAAGKAAGVQTVFLPTGLRPEDQWQQGESYTDYRAKGLQDAVSWICQKLDG